MRPEREVEIKLWDWLLNRSESVKEVLFNSKNEVGARKFNVKGEINTIPDLVVFFVNHYTGEYEYAAIEVKDASNSGNVRRGSKAFTEYFKKYVEGKTKYFIEDNEIKINHFIVATQYSEEGHLMKNESVEFNEGVRGNTAIGNYIVPFKEFYKTKEFYRGMIHPFAEYRKKNNLSKTYLPSVGVLISDVITNFEKDEIKMQPGTKGMPMIQCVSYNKIKMRWRQCLMKI